jgi:hypothetical protein
MGEISHTENSAEVFSANRLEKNAIGNASRKISVKKMRFKKRFFSSKE